MEDTIVKFETAKLAKKKGFNLILKYGLQSSLYSKEGNHVFYANYGLMYSGLSEGYIAAPTQSLLQKWLREVHKVDIWIEPMWCINAKPACSKVIYCPRYSTNPEGDEDEEEFYFDTYEEALEFVLVAVLKKELK